MTMTMMEVSNCRRYGIFRLFDYMSLIRSNFVQDFDEEDDDDGSEQLPQDFGEDEDDDGSEQLPQDFDDEEDDDGSEQLPQDFDDEGRANVLTG